MVVLVVRFGLNIEDVMIRKNRENCSVGLLVVRDLLRDTHIEFRRSVAREVLEGLRPQRAIYNGSDSRESVGIFGKSSENGSNSLDFRSGLCDT
jgi:hypothetical protein